MDIQTQTCGNGHKKKKNVTPSPYIKKKCCSSSRSRFQNYIPQNALAGHLCLNFTAEQNLMKSFLFVCIFFPPTAVSFTLSNNRLKWFHRITKNESNPPCCLVMNTDQACLRSHCCKSQGCNDSARERSFFFSMVLRIKNKTKPHLSCQVNENITDLFHGSRIDCQVVYQSISNEPTCTNSSALIRFDLNGMEP